MRTMTKLMQKAIEALRSLPEEKQDAVAESLLSRLEDDQRWDQTSIKYADKLRNLADEALQDQRAGRTAELDPEKL